MGATVAHRTCAYLLPYIDPDDSRPQYAGIPGLRLAEYTRYGYQLLHLPTGTGVKIHDERSRCPARSRVQALDVERRMGREKEAHGGAATGEQGAFRGGQVGRLAPQHRVVALILRRPLPGCC